MKLFQLLEAPIPDADDLNDYPHTDKVFNFLGNHKKFKQRFTAIGSGSSRIAFYAPTDISLFKAEDASKVQVTNGKADTVIKLATNARGLLQNLHEMRVYQAAKNAGYDRFLAPIIDWSGNPEYKNNIKYTIIDSNDFIAKNGDTKTPFWIQYPKAEHIEEYDNDTFGMHFQKRFGFFPEHPVSTYNIYSLNSKTADDAKLLLAKAQERCSPKQKKEFQALLDLCYENDLKMIDLDHNENWGLINDQLVIIDYGYTGEVASAYHDEDVTLSMEVSDNEVTVRVE